MFLKYVKIIYSLNILIKILGDNFSKNNKCIVDFLQYLKYQKRNNHKYNFI